MAEQPIGKLAVILHADVVGSTVLVQRDERRAHERITSAFQRFSRSIEDYGGQVHEIRGDALVAEFSRASDAVCAAIAFQQENTAHNGTLTDDIIPEVRVGVSLGEVVVADNTVTGAGVVLAQRVEQLAEPGGVCITEAIREATPGRLNLEIENLGAQELKGFEQPVHVHVVRLMSGVELPPPERDLASNRRRALVIATAVAALVVAAIALGWWAVWQADTNPASVALPEEPSIAVLPFDNLSGDEEQDPIADGLTEDVIATLARVPDLIVIARNSTFTYKGKPVKVQQLAEDLGVRYVLEGSVQRSGDRLRVTTQLIDALDGSHLWAGRYDRPAENFFALQDEIAREVLVELQVKLTLGENARISSRETKSMEAWILTTQARAEALKFKTETMIKARELYQAATEADPEYSRAWSGLSWTYWFEGRMGGWQRPREAALKQASELAEHAIALDPEEPSGYGAMANVLLLNDEQDRAVEFAEKAVTLAPSDYVANSTLAWQLVWAEEPERALEAFALAKRLSPRYPAWFPFMEGLAQHMLGRYEDAIVTLQEGIRRQPGSSYPRARLIAVYSDLNRMEEAEAAAAELLTVEPGFTVTGFVRTLPFKEPERKEWVRELLLKAGLPA